MNLVAIKAGNSFSSLRTIMIREHGQARELIDHAIREGLVAHSIYVLAPVDEWDVLLDRVNKNPRGYVAAVSVRVLEGSSHWFDRFWGGKAGACAVINLAQIETQLAVEACAPGHADFLQRISGCDDADAET